MEAAHLLLIYYLGLAMIVFSSSFVTIDRDAPTPQQRMRFPDFPCSYFFPCKCLISFSLLFTESSEMKHLFKHGACLQSVIERGLWVCHNLPWTQALRSWARYHLYIFLLNSNERTPSNPITHLQIKCPLVSNVYSRAHYSMQQFVHHYFFQRRPIDSFNALEL